MPFKDINCEQLNHFDEMRHQLRKKIAVINKSSNPALGPTVKLATIELITGKPIQPKTDPIHELLQQQKLQRLTTLCLKLHPTPTEQLAQL